MSDNGPDLIGYLNRIASTYGLEPEAFLDMFAAQGHCCAICPKSLTLFAEDLADAPVVDHDHNTGEVRGILCRGCNTAVGFIEKNRTRTKNAFAYLKRTKSNGTRCGTPMWNIQHHFGKYERAIDSGRPKS